MHKYVDVDEVGKVSLTGAAIGLVRHSDVPFELNRFCLISEIGSSRVRFGALDVDRTANNTPKSTSCLACRNR